MANIIYNAGLRDLLKGATAIDTGTYKCLLERDTSTYSPDKDDDSLLDQPGFVEISVASYARQILSSITVTADDVNDQAVIDCGDINFGTLEAGQTVKSVIVARDDGLNYVPLLRIDTDSGGLLPRALGGGNFTVQISSNGLIILSQA